MVYSSSSSSSELNSIACANFSVCASASISPCVGGGLLGTGLSDGFAGLFRSERPRLFDSSCRSCCAHGRITLLLLLFSDCDSLWVWGGGGALCGGALDWGRACCFDIGATFVIRGRCSWAHLGNGAIALMGCSRGGCAGFPFVLGCAEGTGAGVWATDEDNPKGGLETPERTVGEFETQVFSSGSQNAR